MASPRTTVWIVASLLPLFGTSTALAQNEEDLRSCELADSVVKATLGASYAVGYVLDVDRVLADPTTEAQSLGLIFEDPNHQLQHSLVISFGKWDSVHLQHRYGRGVLLNDSGGVAIVRSKKLVWKSERFILHYAGAGISGFVDLNNDGIVDLLVSQSSGSQNERQTLWLVTPSPRGGKLINQVNGVGESVIIGAYGSFQIVNSNRDHLKAIHAIDPDHSGLRDLVYEWNGSLFDRVTQPPGQKRN